MLHFCLHGLVSSTDIWISSRLHAVFISSEEDFFSKRTAAIICGQLNIDAIAPVLPDRSWRNWIAQSGNEYKKTLNEILHYYAGSLSSELIGKISSVEHILLLSAFPTMLLTGPPVDRQLGIRRAPLMCLGAESAIEKDLGILFSLYKEIRGNESRYGISGDWKFLNMSSDKRWPRHLLGRDRFQMP
jgi:hypothetical protein